MDETTLELLEKLIDHATGAWNTVECDARGVNTLPESQAAIAIAACQIALQLDRIATLLERQAMFR